MNAAEIGAFIRDPNKLGKEHIEDLKDLCESNSYSGLLHVLYLKALGNSKSVDFENNLKNLAIKVPNRELLYHLIHDEPVLRETRAVDVAPADVIKNQVDFQENAATNVERDLVEAANAEIQETPFDEIKIDDGAELIESMSSIDLDAIEEAQIPEFDLILPVSDLPSIAIEEEKMFESSDVLEELEDEKQLEANEEVAEEDVVAHEVEEILLQKEEETNALYSLDDVSWLDNNITFDGFSTSVESESGHEDELASTTETEGSDDNLKFVVSESPETKLDDAHDKRKTFYDWLNVSNAPNANEKIVSAESTFYSNEMQIDEPKVESNSQPFENQKEKVQAIVDRFIEAEPKISRPKAEFFSPARTAKESVNEDGIPVSETLARIYELQGNYPKAIAVLERLKELLPHKAAEFDLKIVEIGDKI